MKFTRYIPAVLALALFFSGPAMAAGKKLADTTQSHASLDGKAIKGKVLETMTVPDYTYLRIDAPEGKIWVAIAGKNTIEVGQDVQIKPGMAMVDFTSNTLGKTFDVIVFSTGLEGQNTPETPKKDAVAVTADADDISFDQALQAEAGAANPHAGMGAAAGAAAMAQASGGSTTAIVPAAEVKVDKATGKNAQTVGECFANAKKLDKTKVKVQGKVMKISKMIMGKNWVHVQDGTGNPMKNTHDLVVTTLDTPKTGSIVVIEGTLHANKDFGAGYKYEVIIEDAEIK